MECIEERADMDIVTWIVQRMLMRKHNRINLITCARQYLGSLGRMGGNTFVGAENG